MEAEFQTHGPNEFAVDFRGRLWFTYISVCIIKCSIPRSLLEHNAV